MFKRRAWLIGAVLALCAGAPQPLAAQNAQNACSDVAGVAQTLLTDFVAPFNKAWPTVAVDTGIDPLKNVYDGSVNLGCGLEGIGDAYCGVQASSCSEFYADVDISEIDGLSNLSITSLTLETQNQQAGTVCPYYTSGPYPVQSFGCSLYGTATGNVKLNGQAKIVVSSIALKAKCALVGVENYTETLWSGSVTCTASGGTGTVQTAEYCGGLCSVNAGLAALDYLKARDLKMNLTGINCKVNTSDVVYAPIADVLDPILSETADLLGKTIEEAAAPAVKTALNNLVAQIMPVPATCTAQSSQ